MLDVAQLYHEEFSGRLVSVVGVQTPILLAGRGKLPAQCKVIHKGDLTIIYGFPLLFTKDIIFPQLVIDDFRRQHQGRVAIEFMLNKGNSYPRADAVGLLMSSEARADLFMKEVDVAAGLRAFAVGTDTHIAMPRRVEIAIWLGPSANSIEDRAAVPGDDGSLMLQALHGYRCEPSVLPDLLERITQATNP